MSRYSEAESAALAEIASFCDPILARRTDGLTFIHVTPANEIDPRDFLARLRESGLAKTILLPDGYPLWMDLDTYDYFPHLGICAEDATIANVHLRVSGWSLGLEKSRPIWLREISIMLEWRSEPEGYACEEISLFASNAGWPPKIYSNLWASAYFETGYEGHGGVSSVEVDTAEVARFLRLAAELT